MFKAKVGFTSLVLVSMLLIGCGQQLPLTSVNSLGVITAQSVDDASTNNLQNINNAIDFATSTKSSTNNYNVKFYMDGKNAYPAMEELIVNAKESINIELYIFKDDYTGKRFADALVQKVKEGVEVNLIYDYLGNTNVKVMNYMAKNGVRIETYNKELLTKTGVNISHRKIFIADGQRAIIGGMNIGEEYESKWHDTMVSYEGDAVKATLKEFIYDWNKASGSKLTTLMQKALENPIVAKDELKKSPLRVAVTSPKEQGKKIAIKRMFLSAIDTAKDNIKVAMPYFSDDDFINHLLNAKKRGVKVTALMPSKSDQKLFDILSTVTTNQLVQGGVEVFRTGVKDNTFSHSKVMTVDNVWTTLGSCNADYRAFNDNQELNIGISDPEFTQNINKEFFGYHIDNSEKGQFKKIPWYKKPFYSLIEGLDDLF
ncbi:MAG: phosphatidylserine/phosphatidylglycerophosphate/cardiolipin synthase family protein [Candidatus Sericytochromatia bacterium]|nr:phosphatidylserine/phosphatidylglycerophosphate/cardiolipin synthase family protein [Candidatus Sericytochromatia bacterium]